MSPPAFDLRLWVICSGLASGLLAVPTAITFVDGHGSIEGLVLTLATALFLGVVLQDYLLAFGFGWTRNHPEPAEDYEEGGEARPTGRPAALCTASEPVPGR